MRPDRRAIADLAFFGRSRTDRGVEVSYLSVRLLLMLLVVMSRRIEVVGHGGRIPAPGRPRKRLFAKGPLSVVCC